MSSREFAALPPIESCRLISFDRAYVKLVRRLPILVVEGEAPCLNTEVSLSPRIYIDCPDYWGIEVVGCLRGGICLPATKPYTVALPLPGIIGYQGIEVIGARGSEKIEVEGGCERSAELTAE